jgi:hypothetical protein
MGRALVTLPSTELDVVIGRGASVRLMAAIQPSLRRLGAGRVGSGRAGGTGVASWWAIS